MDNNKQKYSPDPWFDSDQDQGLLYSRSTSAPPVLELSKEQLMLLQSQKTKHQLLSGINDIRLQPDYERFYEINKETFPTLPPPLDHSFYAALREKEGKRTDELFTENYLEGSNNAPMTMESKFFPQAPQSFPQNGLYPQTYEQYPYTTFPPAFTANSTMPSFPANTFQGGNQYTQQNFVVGSETDEYASGSDEETQPEPEPQQKKSAAIDIKRGPWNLAPGKPANTSNTTRQRNKNLGKVAINMDTNLSSSTDDLLKLAGGGPLQRMRVRLASYEESPPGSTLASMDSPVSTRNIRMYYNENSKKDNNSLEKDTQREFDDMVKGFSKLSSEGQNGNSTTNATANSNGTASSSPPSESETEKPSAAQICRYFANGFCSRGERCNFLHVEQGTVTNAPSSLLHKTRFKNGRTPIPASRYANLTLEECVGDIASMCLDQHGCRFLQRQLDSGDPKVIQTIFSEVNEHMVELMSDPFGNYLCQKLIEHCTESQRLEIVKTVTSDLVQISKNMHGTRAVQKLIEHLGSSEENKLIRKALKGSVVGLIQDLNGNHVIQKCLHKMEPNDNQFIYDAVAQHCVQVSTHRHGCCVMQRCVDHATYDQKLQLVEQIKKTALTLVQDAFGNYVVQYALDLEIPTLPTDLIKQLNSKLHVLSKQKFSSNVVEKCLRSGSPECVARVLREFLGENPDGTGAPTNQITPQLQQNLIDLLQDSFGNYVIQTCLSEGATKAPAEYLRMAAILRPFVHNLRNAPYIKRIHNLLNLPTSLPPVSSGSGGTTNGSGSGNGNTTTTNGSGSAAAGRAEQWVPVGGAQLQQPVDTASVSPPRRQKQRSRKLSSSAGNSQNGTNNNTTSNGSHSNGSSPVSEHHESSRPMSSSGPDRSTEFDLGGSSEDLDTTSGMMIGNGTGMEGIPHPAVGVVPVPVQPLYYPYYHTAHPHMHPLQYQQPHVQPYFQSAQPLMDSPPQLRHRPPAQPQQQQPVQSHYHLYQQQYYNPQAQQPIQQQQQQAGQYQSKYKR